ncbi:L-histidine N(alpha)-methyltransferase [Halioglobus maricola]|uniref:L-histidine N(Alpha)-methyltransferase n=1 Tax=Halioglobus maricola TaxID=2601894 RepID=A0A5P9NQ80_9GAMM|nr:L-histidine N(alpha)-methyltransferase [Halioglobus maricola]
MAILQEIGAGLNARPKYINPKYFYDEYGSQLFDEITRLDEYYPTRTETFLLERFADDIARVAGRGRVLLEPGAGSCAKVRLLLRALAPACYVPIDISRDYLFDAARQLQSEFTDIPIHPIADDMKSSIQLPAKLDRVPRLVFYPGSTIGNYTPEQAAEFLRHVRQTIGDEGGLIIGVDLQKDPDVLNRAYNDAAGITAAFNLNSLTHINTLTGADFDPEGFRHVAFYNEQDCRIEMHLESESEQQVAFADQLVTIGAGERILTEYSYKYTLEGFAQLAATAGLTAKEHWIDDNSYFSLQYFSAH